MDFDWIARTNHLIRRARAVRRIADHIADRDGYVITVPPGALETLIAALEPITPWIAYVDNGTGLVLRTGLRGPLCVVDRLVETAAVVVVPRSVPVDQLSAAIGQPVPADGSQDLLLLRTSDGPIYWPLLFVEALDILDPSMSAALRAGQVKTPTPCC